MGLFDFNANVETPQMLAYRRDRAASLADQIGRGQPSIGSGIGDLFRGLSAGLSNYRTDNAMRANVAGGRSAEDNLYSLLSQPPQAPGMAAPPSNNAVQSGIKTALATGQPPQLAVYTPPSQAPQGPQNAGTIANQPQIGAAPPQPTQMAAQPVPEPMPAQPMTPAEPPQAAPMQPQNDEAALLPKIAAVLRNPWVSDADRQMLQGRYEQIVKRMDPEYKQRIALQQAQIDHYAKMSDTTSGINDPAKVQEYKFYAKQEADAGNTPLSYEQFTARNSGFGGVSKEDITLKADAIENGNQPPILTGLYRGGLPVSAELEKRHYNLSKANQEWQAANKFISASQGPQQLRVRQNIDALAQSLPHLRELVDKYKAGNYPALNSVMMEAAYHGFVSPEQQSLVNLIGQQISDVQAQTAGVIMGSGAPTDAAFQLAHDQLQKNWSQKSIDDALTNMELNLKYRVNALRNAVPEDNRYVKAPAIAPDAPTPPDASQPPPPPARATPVQQVAPDISGIDPQAIEDLRADPSSADEFDAHFGPGSAAAVLHGG